MQILNSNNYYKHYIFFFLLFIFQPSSALTTQSNQNILKLEGNYNLA
uniref:Uncharacterized protein n=1 Tax=Heterorhabditis bacteriophora TaxID=37862 RepID=A0A1I7W640_HETBA